MPSTAPPSATDGPVRPRPVVSAVWRVAGALLALAALTAGTHNVVSLLAHEERTEVTTFDASSVATIDIASSAGSVIVVGRDRAEEITVTARISEGLRRTGNRQRLVGDRLELRSSCPVFGSEWCSVRYIVETPPGVDVRARADDGTVEVTGIAGTVTVDNDNGSIDLADIVGDVTATNDNGRVTAARLTSDVVVASTDNGRVTIELIVAPTSVDARASNGRVEVVVPDTDDTYRLDMSSSNGDIDNNRIRTDPDSPRSITIRSGNGDVVARMAP